MRLQRRLICSLIAVSIILLFQSCYKKDIQFQTDLGETYTQLLQVDTVAVNMSTVLLDSFPTNGTQGFLLGRYRDSVLGTVSAKPYFQLSLPSDVTLSQYAVYDSMALIVKLSKYYYGDTTVPETIRVNELAVPIDYTYNNYIYNTTSVPEKSTPLANQTTIINPNNSDSLIIRLSDAKGNEMFNKLMQQANEVQGSDQFLNYFKGLSLNFSNNNSAAVYGIGTSADSIKMRLYYHVTTPYLQSLYKDFAYQKNSFSFNQILTDRKGTLLNGPSVKKEFFASETAHQSFAQTTTGVLLKMTFPSLRNVLQAGAIVKLLKATLFLRPAKNSYDLYNLRLPNIMHLALTNGSNNIGTVVKDSTNASVLYSQPSIDFLYGANTYYRFDVTSTINTYISSGGYSDAGFYLMQDNPGNTGQINRVIMNDSQNIPYNSQLILSVLTIKN